MLFAFRPWGWWAVLYKGKRFKVKLLHFKKGSSISLQRHKYRAELWCFIYGRGKLRGICRELRRGDSVHINKMAWHKYTATKPSLILEIQYGEVCHESDIERKG